MAYHQDVSPAETPDRREFLTRGALLALGWLAPPPAEGSEAPSIPGFHPRVMITPELVREMAEKVSGPFAGEYRILLETARMGPRYMENQYSIPGAFMEAGLAALIERELGRDGSQFAELVIGLWRRREYQQPGLARHFGWQGLLYDWVYDYMTPQERVQFGELLGEWVATWWKTAEVNIPRSGWWYNQHWGPAHLDVPNHRIALAAKLFMSLATLGSAGRFEDAVQLHLRSFYQKFLADGLPALDEMGGIWSESNGHGNYGPLLVIPLSYQAVLTGMGFNAFEAGAPRGFGREFLRAGLYSIMPHNQKLAYIDDSNSGYAVQHARCAPLLARHFRDGVARWLSDKALVDGWLYHSGLRQHEVWQRIAFLPADVEPVSPSEAGWPLAYLFQGAGHVYMHGAWEDPDSTWAFFGAGPSYAGHSRDDEGHFLISKRGQLVNRSGGAGHNDDCYYSGGSLIYNIVTIYHPHEKMRRDAYNENDGGLLRYVYSQNFPVERGHIASYWHDDNLATYAAADLTRGYWREKAREVTRQFLYLRGNPECFVVFDRVESTDPAFGKVWFLHLPDEPVVDGNVHIDVPEHVSHHDGDTSTWLSHPAGDTGLFSSGRSRMIMKTLLPRPGRITKRGGKGHDFWGHPHNPDAQYNHTLDRHGAENAAYRRPPYSPWRLEVQPAEQRARDYFLHLLYVTDESVEAVPPAELVQDGGRQGARFALGQRMVTVWFDMTGPLGGRLAITEGGKVIHDEELPREIASE